MRALTMLVFVAGCAGHAQLVATVDEPPGANCPSGGVAIEAGVDDNGDGTLSSDEVDSESYVCSHVPADPVVLADARPESPGANCALGGTAVRTGLDSNGNGQLDDGEVLHTIYICNGAGSDSTTVELRPEPPGANCALGGMAILTGVDADHDGTLEPAEIASTSYVCNGQLASGDVLDASFRIRNSIEAQLLDGVHVITGDLFIDCGNSADAIVVPDLREIDGTLNHISDCASFASPSLVEVRGDINIVAISAMQFDLHAVTHARNVGVTGPAVVDVSGLVTVDEAIGYSLIEVPSIDLPNLQTVGNLFLVQTDGARPTLTSIHVPLLGAVPSLEVRGAVLTELDFPSLTHIDNLSLSATILPAIDLPSLATIGQVFISDNGASSLSLPAVTSIGGPVRIDALGLSTCAIDDLLARVGYTGPRTINAGPCP